MCPETSLLRVFAPLATTTVFIFKKTVSVGSLGAEVAPFLWEELRKFPECGKGESQKEMGTRSAKTRNCKKKQKETHQTSEVLKRVHLEP